MAHGKSARKTRVRTPKDPYAAGQRSLESAAAGEQQAINEQRSYYQKTGAEEQTRITGEYESAATGLGQTQEKQYAGRATSLITSGGGFLGATQSQEGVLQNLGASQEQEMQGLYQKRDSAVAQARNAYLEKDFALARESSKVASQLSKDILSYQDRVATQKIQAAQESRAKGTYETQQADNLLNNLAAQPAGFQFDPKSLQSIAQAKGVSVQAVRNLITGQQAAAKAKGYKEQLEAQKNIVDILSAYPSGTKVPMPDGATLTAMGSAGDITSSIETNAYGDQTMVAFNKLTGKITKIPLGRTGKPLDSAFNGGGGGSVSWSKSPQDLKNFFTLWMQGDPSYKPGDLQKMKEDPGFFDATQAAAQKMYYELQNEGGGTPETTRVTQKGSGWGGGFRRFFDGTDEEIRKGLREKVPGTPGFKSSASQLQRQLMNQYNLPSLYGGQPETTANSFYIPPGSK